jgi:glutathione S-transferase
MRLLDAELADERPHICGEAFTLADIPLGLVVNRWFAVQGFGKPELPAVSAYFERLSQRPAFLRHGRNGLP